MSKPSDSRSDEPEVGPGGARERDIGTTTGAFATVETPAAVDGDTAVDVCGVSYDDEPSRVVVTASVEGRRVELTLGAADARTFAEQVAEAARFAVEGE